MQGGGRTFEWRVEKLNDTMHPEWHGGPLFTAREKTGDINQLADPIIGRAVGSDLDSPVVDLLVELMIHPVVVVPPPLHVAADSHDSTADPPARVSPVAELLVAASTCSTRPTRERRVPKRMGGSPTHSSTRARGQR